MKRWIGVALFALVVSILHITMFLSSWGDSIEPAAVDLWHNIRGPIAPPQDYVLVAMDETSYAVLEIPMDQAWPRALHAQLINRLADAGAKRVVMDVLFLGPSSKPEADRALADAIKRVPTVIGIESGTREQSSAAGSFTLEELMEPLDIFMESAETTGLVRMPNDDGHVRRFVVPRSEITKDIATLAEAGAGLQHSAPGLPAEQDFIRYYGPPGTIRTISYHQVMNPKGTLPKDTFKDKIVFVGLNLRTELGPAQKDSYLSPYYKRGQMFGVEIEATASANLLTKDWIRRAPRSIETIVLFIVTFLMTGAIFYLKPQWATVLFLGFVAAWFCCSYLLFLAGYFIPGVLLNFFLLISSLGSSLTYYFITHRSQQQVERAFQFYLSPEMAKQMRTDPKALGLGGESVYATAMFTDIAGFTDITETMSATKVSEMLNAYFTEVMDVIFERQGTLIKFIGDAVFAVWGAPIKVDHHAQLACETAITIQREVKKFNASNRFPPLNTRIGLHTGPMVVGNLGSKRRFDYTAIGDTVNMAARLEGANKYFGTHILVTDAVKKEFGNTLSPLSLGALRVVGKKERMAIHTLFEDPLDPEIEKEWLAALTDFRLRKWDSAADRFSKVAQGEPRLEKAVSLYLFKIDKNRSHPPEEDWQGEIVLESK